MIVNGPDGTPHNFPDDATNDEILQFFGQGSGTGSAPVQGPGTGQGIVPGSPQAIAQNQAANTAPVQRPIDPSHYTLLGATSDTARGVLQGVSGGLYNPTEAGIKSLLLGTSYKDELAANQQRSEDASTVSPGTQLAAQVGGAIVGPGKLSQVENAARQIPSFTGRLLTRLGGGAAEGSVYSGVNAAANQQKIIPDNPTDVTQWANSPMGKGAIIGGTGSAAMPVVIKGAGKIANWFPGAGGDLPAPTTSSQMLDPRKGGGYSFVSNADKATAAKLAPLENMQYNASLPSPRSLPTQISEVLDKNINTSQSMADTMGYTKEEQDALSKVGKTTPISSFMVAHPRVTQGMISGIGELPASLMGLHGNYPEMVATELGSVAGHVAAATIPNRLANQGAQDALDQAKRIIAGQPTTTDRWNAVNDPRVGQALQSILFNQTLQNQ